MAAHQSWQGPYSAMGHLRSSTDQAKTVCFHVLPNSRPGTQAAGFWGAWRGILGLGFRWDPNSRTDKGSPGAFARNQTEIHRPLTLVPRPGALGAPFGRRRMLLITVCMAVWADRWHRVCQSGHPMVAVRTDVRFRGQSGHPMSAF